MKAVIDARLDATEKELGELYLPRIIRLCRKFKFSEVDSKIAIYALVIQSGYDHEGRFGYGIDCLTCCQNLDIPLRDILEFLDKDRLHMEQGFFPDVQDSYILSCAITYDTDFCKALMGSQLKSQEFLKIEQTKLADVIAEEPGNEHYRQAHDRELFLVTTTKKNNTVHLNRDFDVFFVAGMTLKPRLLLLLLKTPKCPWSLKQTWLWKVQQ